MDTRHSNVKEKLFGPLVGICVFLVLLSFLLFWRTSDGSRKKDINIHAALSDPEIREIVVGKLVAQSGGVFDSHPDPFVGRVLQPNIEDVEHTGVSISTNNLGMRERPIKMPKPDSVVRIVILGDSFVFGDGVRPEDRMGAFLEGYLSQRAIGNKDKVECLHTGVSGWNATAAVEYLRRQLGELRPDLVIQLSVGNDLDDNTGVRGFGVPAGFDPRYPHQTDARISIDQPLRFYSEGEINFLQGGLDWESRHRLQDLTNRVDRLVEATLRYGGHYVLAINWGRQSSTIMHYLSDALNPDQLLMLPKEFQSNQALWNSSSDTHWNRQGHELFAQLLYYVIRSRGLLPQLNLAPWPDVEARAEILEATAIREAEESRSESKRRPYLTRISFEEPLLEEMRQVYGGIDSEGVVSPYASLVLRCPKEAQLLIRGRCLQRLELDGTRVRVYLDDREVGQFTLNAGNEIRERWAVPPDLQQNEYLSVRFQSDDWVYTGLHKRRCISFVLNSVALKQAKRASRAR